MPAIKAPLKILGQVHHLGSLQKSDKGNRGDSLEGDGLSISIHPDAWRRIARLGGAQEWVASAAKLKIADGHQLLKQSLPAMLAWAEKAGLVKAREVWRLRTHDDEIGNVEQLFDTEKKALAEVRGMEPSEFKIKAINSFVPTAALLERLRRNPRGVGKACVTLEQDVATVWAQDHRLDGIWWSDRLSPATFSAPRGVIFLPALDKVTWESAAPAVPQVRRPR